MGYASHSLQLATLCLLNPLLEFLMWTFVSLKGSLHFLWSILCELVEPVLQAKVSSGISLLDIFVLVSMLFLCAACNFISRVTGFELWHVRDLDFINPHSTKKTALSQGSCILEVWFQISGFYFTCKITYFTLTGEQSLQTSGESLNDSTAGGDGDVSSPPQGRRNRREACTCPFCKDGDSRYDCRTEVQKFFLWMVQMISLISWLALWFYIKQRSI